MKASEAKNLLLQLATGFFSGYNVVFANQSRMAKPQIPLVTIRFGNLKRPQAANQEIDDDGVIVGYYLSRLTVTVDLFTNGTAIEEDGTAVAYENTALDEMLAFADYLNSPVCVSWCSENNVSILIESDAQDLTGIVNDNNYEYRSRLEVLYSFTQETDTSTGDVGYFETTDVEEET